MASASAKKGKLNLNTKKNVFKCNRCGESGGMLSLYGRIYGLDTGIVPYGTPEGERGAEVGREDGRSVAVNWKLNQV